MSCMAERYQNSKKSFTSEKYTTAWQPDSNLPIGYYFISLIINDPSGSLSLSIEKKLDIGFLNEINESSCDYNGLSF